MDDGSRQPDATPAGDAATGAPDTLVSESSCEAEDGAEFDESLVDEVSALIDDGRTYVEAELAFQKTRAKFAGRLVGTSLVLVIVALILLHIAFLALAVGLVIALEPVVTIWGAIAIVFGGLLLLVGLLGWMAMKRAEKLGKLFESGNGGAA